MRALVLASLLQLASTLAHGQDTLALYGVVDLGLKVDDGTTGRGAWSITSGNRQGSRLGLRAKETLAPGWRAVLTIESGFNADDGTLANGGRLWGRQAWIGLEGPAGTITIGRQYSALYLSLKAIDPFRIQEAGDMQRTFGYGVAKLEPLSRADNAVVYATAPGSAWQLRLGHGFGESAGVQPGSTSFLDIAYESDIWTFHATWQHSRDLGMGPVARPGGLADVTGLGTARADARVLFSGAVVRVAGVKLHAGLGDTRLDAGRSARLRNALVGITVPVLKGNLVASINRLDVQDQPGRRARQTALGYAYPFSKRTDVYLSASSTNNRGKLALNAYRSGASGRELRAGLSHSF